jgi:hypothetical protein
MPDRILVLDRGRCVGLGTHDALLRQCRLYRQMWETQQLGEPPRAVTAPVTLEDRTADDLLAVADDGE